MAIEWITAECNLSTLPIDPAHAIAEAVAFGFVKVGQSMAMALRIGNDGASSLDYSLSVADSNVTVTGATTGTLTALQLSGTITLTVSIPQAAEEQDYDTDLICTTTTGTYSLPISYSSLGPPEQWENTTFLFRPGPDGEWADNVVSTFGQAYRIYCFDPVRLDEDPYGSVRIGRMSAGRLVGFDGDIESRLDPTNTNHGYTVSVRQIRASFQSENEEVSTSYANLDASTNYSARATLYIPSSVDVSRKYAMFDPGSTEEPAQYKRSVFVLQRYGRMYAIENLRPMEFKSDLAFFEADLVEIHVPSPSDPSHYNPFSTTYAYGGNQPYGYYPGTWSSLATMLEGFTVTTATDSENPYV